jgi:hypothetical protein
MDLLWKLIGREVTGKQVAGELLQLAATARGEVLEMEAPAVSAESGSGVDSLVELLEVLDPSKVGDAGDAAAPADGGSAVPAGSETQGGSAVAAEPVEATS